MAIGLGWLGVGVGFAGCLATFLMAASSAGPAKVPRRAGLAIGLTLLLTLVIWAISMQRQPPFSTGQILGYGFLFGGVTGTVAILLSTRLSNASGRAASLAMHSLAFLALLGVSIVFTTFASDPHDALLGFGIGAAMAAILGYYSRESEAALPAISIEAWALFGITLAAATLLAVEHFATHALRAWWSLPILLATTVCIASYVGTEISATRLGKRFRSPAVLSSLVAATLVLGLSALYSLRIVSTWQLFMVVASGLGIAAIAAWLISGMRAQGRLDVAAVLVLLVTAFVVVAFKLWSGLGIAVGLLAAWTLVLGRSNGVKESWSSENPPLHHSNTPALLSLAVTILLFRLFVQEYRFTMGTQDFRIHYTFVGAMLGLVLPFIFASALSRVKDSDGDWWALASVGLIGLLAAATPVLLYTIWEIKVVTGWMFGVTAAVAFMFIARVADDAPLLDKEGVGGGSGLAWCRSIGLLVIGAELVAIKFVSPLSNVELTRATRVWVLGAAVAVVIIGMVITAIMSARRERQAI